MATRRTITASTPGDYPSRHFMLGDRTYHIVACGYVEEKSGRRRFVQSVKNDRGDYKDYGHTELLALIAKNGCFLTETGERIDAKGNLIDTSGGGLALTRSPNPNPPGRADQDLNPGAVLFNGSGAPKEGQPTTRPTTAQLT